MFKRLFTISLVLALFASFTMAQNMHILKPNGDKTKLAKASSLQEALKVSKVTNFKGNLAKSVIAPANFTAAGKLDTINYRPLGGAFNTNFGFNGQDVMFTYFEATADMTIKGIGYTVSDDEGSANATVSLRLIKLNWTIEDLKAFGAAEYQGYYPSTGDGFNEADYFGEEATGNWVAGAEGQQLPPWTDNADPGANGWDYDLWSDGGFAWPTTAVASELTAPVYNWLDLSTTGLGDADVVAGEIFAVVAIHDGTVLDGDRIGFWSDNTIGVPTWKYYEAGRLAADQPGWWVRMYAWDFAVAVDITGDTPPSISGVDILGTTLSTETRTVTATIIDENPGGGDAGIASANLLYSIDGGDMVSVAMSASGDVFSGDIPGQTPGTDIVYSIEATDVGGLYTRWARDVNYKIFAIENSNALLVFNGPAVASGYPQSYYFGIGDFASYGTLEWSHDSWAYGALTEDLVNGYTNIIEIASDGPAVINSDIIAAWLAGDASRNYLLAGDEWLGAQSGWTNQAHEAGSFHNDVLGITFEYNDVNYAAAGDDALASMFNAVEGSDLGGDLFTLHAQVSADSGWTASIAYDPTYEIGYANWLDGADFADDVQVDMTGIGMDGATYNVAGHRTLAAGNKIAFLAYDPLSLNSHSADGSGGEYWWYGFTAEAPQVKALYWFDAVVSGVNEDGTLPEAYTLSQNYPNPFNPTTVISYSVPEKADVTLKVFNLLGQEVAQLVSEVKNVGTHEVNFNANNLTSGVYFYTIKAGNFTSTRKMMLIK